MITIAHTIEKIIEANPSYGEALALDIVNFSSLARRIRPEIEEMLLEPVTEGAVVMALRRHADLLLKKFPVREQLHHVRNISVRSEITEVAFVTSPHMSKIHQQLLKVAEQYDNPFFSFGQGTGEATFDISDVLVPHLLKLAAGEKKIALFKNLAVISARLPLDTVTVPGVYFPFVRTFAWNKINVYQIISYFTEINFVIDEKDIERAFAIVKGLAKRAEKPAGTLRAVGAWKNV